MNIKNQFQEIVWATYILQERRWEHSQLVSALFKFIINSEYGNVYRKHSELALDSCIEGYAGLG